MKKLLLLFSSLLLTFSSYAQTQVSGGIFTSTTWTLANSPYQVTDDVVIFPDGSLTIEPGVEVRFASGTKLELRAGDLFVNGSEMNPITFTLDASTPSTAPKWVGIENTSLASEAIIVELNHVIFEYAQTAIHYGAGSAYRYISNAIFRYNDRGPFDGGLGYNWVTITNSEFLENGIGMEGRMSAIDCRFENNETGFANPHTFSNITEGGRVTNCEFIDNDLAVGSIGQIITIGIIEGSTFTGNGRGFSGYWAIVDSSSFMNQTEHAIFASKGEIQESLFSQNKIGFLSSFSNSELFVHHNEFVQDTIAVRIDGPGGQYFENTFCSSADTVVQLNTDQPIDLNYNCWCTTDLAEIADMVIDAYDDVSLGIASYDILSTNCQPELMYPGDANNNGLSNASDLLQVGLAYGLTGTVRANASTNWIGQESDNWTTIFANNVNAKHADSNGDGVVDASDVTAIEINYGAMHSDVTTYSPLMAGTDMFSLSLEMPDTLSVGQTVVVDVMLADANQPMSDFYGIAFAIEADGVFFEANSFALNLSDSWLGTSGELLSVSREFIDDGRVEIGIVKNNQQPSTGFGKIASFEFVMSEDIIAAMTSVANLKTFPMRILDIESITSLGGNLEVVSEDLEVFLTNTNDLSSLVNNAIFIYPNPVSEILNLNYNDLDIEQIRIYNTSGILVNTLFKDFEKISLYGFRSGIYYMEIQTSIGMGVKRFAIKN